MLKAQEAGNELCLSSCCSARSPLLGWPSAFFLRRGPASSVSVADATHLIAALASFPGVEPTSGDVQSMLAMLQPADDGMVHRDASIRVLSAALSPSPDGPRRSTRGSYSEYGYYAA